MDVIFVDFAVSLPTMKHSQTVVLKETQYMIGNK